METKVEVKIEVKEATEEERTLNVGDMYLYNGVPVKIENFFEIKLDVNNTPVIEIINDINYIIPTNEEMTTSGNEKEKGRIIGVNVKVEVEDNNQFVLIPDVFYGKWSKYSHTLKSNKNITDITNNMFKYQNYIENNQFSSSRSSSRNSNIFAYNCNNNEYIIYIEKIFCIFIKPEINSKPEIEVDRFVHEYLKSKYSYNLNGKIESTDVFTYGCVGTFTINNKKYRKIIPDIRYFSNWRAVYHDFNYTKYLKNPKRYIPEIHTYQPRR